jgi:hypothetical protein
MSNPICNLSADPIPLFVEDEYDNEYDLRIFK